MELRPTTPADLPAMHAVFLAAIGELYHRHAFTPPDPPFEAFAAQQGHLVQHDGERCWCAEDAGEVVAYAAAYVRDDTWFLSSLFVHPRAQGQGLGKTLLDRVWGGRVARRLTITDSIQPVSNALYARRGLIPTTPVLPLAGVPRAEAPADLEPGEGDRDALRALDRAAYGFDRAPEHELWGRAARRTLWVRGGEPAAYSYAWPHGRVGPVAGVDAEAAGAALGAELARFDGAPASVFAPGSAAAVVEAAVGAGLRIAGPPGLLLLSRPHPPPAALALSSFTLL